MLTQLQRDILEFAKTECFHGTLNDFIACTGVSKEEALMALKDLRSKRIVLMPPSLFTSWIGVTNNGWKVMGWK